MSTHKKLKSTSFCLVPLALAATVLALFVLAGCGSGEGDGAAAKGADWTKDEKFVSRLKADRDARGEFVRAYQTVRAEMVKMIAAKKKELGNVSEAELKAALEKDAAWRSLHQRCLDARNALKEQRVRTAATVRARLAPKAPAPGGKPGKNNTISK